MRTSSSSADAGRGTTTSRARRVVGGGLVTIVVAAGSACSGGPDAEPVAQELAEALEGGTFDTVSWADPAPADVAAQVEALLGGLAGVPHTVAVQDIERTGDDDTRRTVALAYTWDFGASGSIDSGSIESESIDSESIDSDTDWTYTAEAALTLDEDAWAVEWQPSILHPALAEGAHLAVRREAAQRGDVLGADGTAIVTDRPVYRIGIDKTKADATAWAASAAAVAGLTGVDAAGFADRVAAAGERAFVEAITLREADAADVLTGIDAIPGAVALPGTAALAPTREFARPVLGTVGEATAEIVAASDGAIQSGDAVGLSGLQQQYDEQLRGVPGVSVEAVPAEGDAEVLFEREPEAGTAVTASIDPDLQVRAEEVLSDVAPPSAIVAIRPSTGAVLAAASGPGGEGLSTATLGQYAPGSTFKVVTALALLRAGLTSETVVACTPTVGVDGRSFKNYDDYPPSALGDISLRTAIANSCNTALIGQRDAVAQADLAAAAAALGLGASAQPSGEGSGGPGVPAFGGDVPVDTGDDPGAGTEHAASMIGQGRVLASPLAMATVAASVASGTTVRPWIVEGAAEDTLAPPPDPVTPDEAEVLRDFMRGVVTEGSAAFLADVPGEAVLAKTGTAEYGAESPPLTHAWMIAAQGDLAVAVFVEDGESGSRTAGPLLEEFLRGS